MYVYHYDYQNKQWNIFFEENGRQMFVFSTEWLEEADRYCRVMNGR